jgi:drug/metabolite transporter (DMT)-like permease
MYQLSEAQIEVVRRRLLASGLRNASLQGELLDHFCCFIEQQIDKGANFETAYADAYKAITPNGGNDIETERLLLLTINKQIGMKRLIYITGFASTFLYPLALTGNMFHWSTFDLIDFTRYFLLFVTILLIMVDAIKKRKSLSVFRKVYTSVGIIGCSLIAVATMIQIYWYNHAYYYTISGFAILAFLFLPLYFLDLYEKDRRHRKEYIAGFLGTFFLFFADILIIFGSHEGLVFLALSAVSFFALGGVILSRLLKADHPHPPTHTLQIVSGLIGCTLVVTAFVIQIAGMITLTKILGIAGLAVMAFIFMPLCTYRLYINSLNGTYDTA